MALNINYKNRALVVRVSGELDLVTAGAFREKVDKALSEMVGKNVLVDMSRVTFIDSSGLGVILGRFRLIKAQNGCMVLFGMPENVKRILEISGVLSVVPACSSENEAWKYIEKRIIKEA